MPYASNKILLRPRVVTVFLALTIIWGVLYLRSAQLQVLPNSRLAELQKRQYNTFINLPARRGLVTDRAGRELAVTVPSYSVFADPQIIKGKNIFAKKVAKILNVPASSIKAKIINPDKRFVWLRRDITREKADELIKNKIHGLGIIEESKRVYPNENLLSQVLGFVGQEGQGLEGLEKYLESTLRGENKKVSVERDARGRPLLIDGRVFADYPAGYDVELTVDSDLQYELEKELQASINLYEADSAMGIIVQPQTGEILAIANAPNFNPNAPFASTAEAWRNRVITDAIEQGSTIKTLIAAAALKNGISPMQKYNCENGQFKLGDRVIREADVSHAFASLNVSEILAKSSNIGSTKMALQLGSEKVREALSDFGIGARLGVSAPGESTGVLHPLPWRPHLLANISFGHGLTATPLQMVMAYSAIANGGRLMKPTILRKSVHAETREENIFSPQLIRTVLNPSQAQTMRLMLHNATSDYGTGKAAQVSGYPVGGKTGTAQKLVDGKYNSGQYFSSFVGFAPVNNPHFVIYVAVDNPKKKYYGAEVAAPVFSRIASYALRKAGISPVIVSEKNVITKAEATTDTENSIIKIREMAQILASEEKNETPDLKGLTVREVLNRVRGTPIKVQLHGKGVVTMSFPSAGEPLPDNRTLRVYLGQLQ